MQADTAGLGRIAMEDSAVFDPDAGATVAPDDVNSFYMIAVGASAEGGEAIKQMISALPDDFGHVMVIVQDLSSDATPLMPEVLARETTLNVHQAVPGMILRPGSIYLIPPRENFGLDRLDGPESDLRFSCPQPALRMEPNSAIDMFFHALADVVGDRAIAVVLSGTGSHGSRGLRAVKDRDGLVIVQNPETAVFDGMPKAAIATRLPDMICQPDRIVPEILHLTDKDRRATAEAFEGLADTDPDYLAVLDFLSAETGVDFRHYKSATLRRRVLRRMHVLGLDGIGTYFERLRVDAQELSRLHHECLVGVTEFFRDVPVWTHLEHGALAELFATGDPAWPLKVWSAGCSTGEEAYSLAMMLERFRRRNGIERDFRVFATDANPDAIRRARRGRYPLPVLDAIPDDYGNFAYDKSHGYVAFTAAIRKKVVFRCHDITEDAPFIRTDLILCRNVLIYFSRELQARTLGLFSCALRDDGLLVLGASESADLLKERFKAEHATLRIYRNRRPEDAGLLRVLTRRVNPEPPSPKAHRCSPMSHRTKPPLELDIMRTALRDLGVCVVIVNDQFQVLQAFGAHAQLLSLPEDGFSVGLPDLLPEGLRARVKMLMRSASVDGIARQARVAPDLRTSDHGYDIACRPLEENGTVTGYAFSFLPRARPNPADPIGCDDKRHAYIAELESELEDLRSFVGDATEELAAANDELLASNAELLATNEELHATNEEIQSVNAELHAANAENRARISELERAKADIENIMENAEIALALLDQDLSIRRFSSGFRDHFDIDVRDIGRPLSTFAGRFDYAERHALLDDAAAVIATGQPRQRQLARPNGEWHQAIIRPFKRLSGKTDGAILTIHDITELKRLQEDLKAALSRVHGVLESQTAGYWDLDMVNNTEYLSPRFKKMLGYDEDDLKDAPGLWRSLVHDEDRPTILANLDTHIVSGGTLPFDNEVRFIRKDGSVVWVICRGAVTEWDSDGNAMRIVGCHIDITALKARESRSLANAEEVRRFAFISAHDLREPIHGVQNCLDVLQEDLSDMLPEEQMQFLSMARDRTERTLDLVSAILDYSKLTDEQLQLSRIDMEQVFQTARKDLDPGREGGHAGVSLQIGAMPLVMGSPVLLSRVAQNLLSNAMKFADRDRPLAISVEGGIDANGDALFSVRDNGIGIPDAELEAVFGIFTRLHTQKEYPGTGLGLALCSRIVQLHGGRIWAEPGVVQGAEFRFTIPHPVPSGKSLSIYRSLHSAPAMGG
jgi:two-component system CheB/CheR fusion protein